MKYRAKILVVDDDIPVCKSIASALKAEGHIVDMAYSGEEALEKEIRKENILTYNVPNVKRNIKYLGN